MDNNEATHSDTHTTTSASEDSPSSFSGTAATPSAAATATQTITQDEVGLNANSTAQAKALKRLQVKQEAAAADEIIKVDEIKSDDEIESEDEENDNNGPGTPLPQPVAPGTVLSGHASSSPYASATYAPIAAAQQQQQQAQAPHHQHKYWMGAGWYICPCTTMHCECGMYAQYHGNVAAVVVVEEEEGEGAALQAAGYSPFLAVHEHIPEPGFGHPSFPASQLAPHLQQQHGVAYGQHTHPAHNGGAPWHGQHW